MCRGKGEGAISLAVAHTHPVTLTIKNSFIFLFKLLFSTTLLSTKVQIAEILNLFNSNVVIKNTQIFQNGSF
jgi:hypothetical protein